MKIGNIDINTALTAEYKKRGKLDKTSIMFF